jgi:hypothetical protein
MRRFILALASVSLLGTVVGCHCIMGKCDCDCAPPCGVAGSCGCGCGCGTGHWFGDQGPLTPVAADHTYPATHGYAPTDGYTATPRGTYGTFPQSVSGQPINPGGTDPLPAAKLSLTPMRQPASQSLLPD